MAKSKSDYLEEAKASGVLAADVDEDAYTLDELRDLMKADRPAFKGSASATEPIVAPDGHVVLSQEDIDARS